MPQLKPSISMAVEMRKERIPGAMSRWQMWRWVLADVLPYLHSFGTAPRRLYQDADQERWLHGAFDVTLYADDAEGYHLNVVAPTPCFFVLWRLEEDAHFSSEPIAMPVAVSLSYHEAGRWLDAQENVEQVPAAAEVVEWLQAFVNEHYRPEPKRRQRPESFRGLADRFGNPASVSVEKTRGRRHD